MSVWAHVKYSQRNQKDYWRGFGYGFGLSSSPSTKIAYLLSVLSLSSYQEPDGHGPSSTGGVVATALASVHRRLLINLPNYFLFLLFDLIKSQMIMDPFPQ
mmetsp:Transcript_4535/g.9947  ORF Transcript_4535/g.9947 Transcript_4535/m.9947 type:complete len:101 (+) Transcript_4535:86-388(+)